MAVAVEEKKVEGLNRVEQRREERSGLVRIVRSKPPFFFRLESSLPPFSIRRYYSALLIFLLRSVLLTKLNAWTTFKCFCIDLTLYFFFLYPEIFVKKLVKEAIFMK